MKATNLSALLFTLIFSSNMYATPLESFSIGASLWQTHFEGDIDAPTVQDYTIDFSKVSAEYNHNFFATLEHNITYLPDFRFTHSNIEQTIIAQYEVLGINGSLDGTINFSYNDYTFYYTPSSQNFDFSIGLTIRESDGEIFNGIFDDPTISRLVRTDHIDLSTEMIFFRTLYQMPRPTMSVGFEVNAGETDRLKALDYTLYIQQKINDNLGFTIGYRYIETEIITKAFRQFVTTSVDLEGSNISLFYQF